MKKHVLFWSIICIFVVALVGCGSRDRKESTGPVQSAEEVSNETASAEGAEGSAETSSVEKSEENTGTKEGTEEVSTEEPNENTEEVSAEEPNENTEAVSAEELNENTEAVGNEEPKENTVPAENTETVSAEESEKSAAAEETTETPGETENRENDQWEAQNNIQTGNKRLNAVFKELKAEYPDGYYWNRGGVTQIPCDHQNMGIESCNYYDGVVSEYVIGEPARQCLGFVAMLSDRLFGKAAPIRSFSDYDELQPGDIIRMSGVPYNEHFGYHSVMVVSKNGDDLETVQCNSDFTSCRIEWDAKYTREDLEQYDCIYLSRRMTAKQSDE